MGDKAISESEWKKFSKGRGYKDAALLKALARVESAEDRPTERLEALSDIGKQAEALRKAHKDDKDLGKYLDDRGGPASSNTDFAAISGASAGCGNWLLRVSS